MSIDVLFEKDFLYPTSNNHEPGSVHIQIFHPNKDARIPLIIESKTTHSPVKDIDTIIRIMQSDIFDRIFIDIKKNVDIYIKVNTELSKEFGDKSFIKVIYNGDRMEFLSLNSIAQIWKKE